jgi:hypothetical protein
MLLYCACLVVYVYKISVQIAHSLLSMYIVSPMLDGPQY